MTLPTTSPTQIDVLSAVRNFLINVLPVSVEVIRGQQNRVSGPLGPDYVVMTPIMMKRLETNVNLYADCAFSGSISGTTLNVSNILHGTINAGNQLFGTGLATGTVTYITGTISGTGGTGTYSISGALGVIPSQTFACGVFLALQPTEETIQIDVYGPNSAENAQIISTLFRDNYSFQFFSGYGATPQGWAPIPIGGTLALPYDGVKPLYADDPRQMSQVFGEMQYELRWTIDAHVQVNQVVVAPQMFAGTLKISPLSVQATYPP